MRIDAVGRFLFERGVYVTLAAYPLVPKDEVGFRVQLTAANTDAEVDTLLSALEELVARASCRWSTTRWRRRHEHARPSRQVRRAAARLAGRCLAFGGGVLRLLYLFVPPFKGSGPVMNVLGLLPVLAIVAGVRHLPARVPGAVVLVRRRASCSSGSAISTPTATRT